MPKRDLKFIIFSLIGVFNTLFDIALYVVFLHISGSILWANIVSTSAALIGSYFLNSRVTFKTKRWTTKSFIGFIIVTLVGLWGLQTGLIFVFDAALRHVPEHSWHIFGGLESTTKSVIPKLLATAFSFVWNYVWYSKVIFKSASQQDQVIAALDEL